MSQVIARRAFRPFWPHEGELHVAVEEVTENVAHLMLVIMVAMARSGSAARAAATDHACTRGGVLSLKPVVA